MVIQSDSPSRPRFLLRTVYLGTPIPALVLQEDFAVLTSVISVLNLRNAESLKEQTE